MSTENGTDRDVVIVGGGIAGATLANRLASAGSAVTVLEQQSAFEDRVRGEGIMPWGVREARRAGVRDALSAAGAVRMRTFVAYRDGVPIERSDATGIRLECIVDGSGGGLAIRHHVACNALLDAAEKAGAEVFRGIDKLEIENDETVRFVFGDQAHERHCRLLVGADGRGSKVRRNAGIKMTKNSATHFVAGILLELEDSPIPCEFATGCGSGPYMVYFQQAANAHRVYLCGPVDELSNFTGEKGTARFLEDMPNVPGPSGDEWKRAKAIGPCGAVRGDDALADTIGTPKRVLIGDAAGYVSPITGQGLSLAFADANDVADTVLDAGTREPDFSTYEDRKRRRVRSVRWNTELNAATFTDPCTDRHARIEALQTVLRFDPMARRGFEAALTGPLTVDPDALPWNLIDDIRAVAAP